MMPRAHTTSPTRDGNRVVASRVRSGCVAFFVHHQVDVMRHLWHRNVVLLFEVMDDPTADSIGLVMEYCSGGCSMAYNEEEQRFISPATGGGLPEPLAAKYFDDVARGLAYLRSRNIAHRDIKPENLLLSDDGNVRIADFGCARCFGLATDAATPPTVLATTSTTSGEARDGKDGGGEDEDDDAPPVATADGVVSDTSGTYYFLSPEACSGRPYSAYDADVRYPNRAVHHSALLCCTS